MIYFLNVFISRIKNRDYAECELDLKLFLETERDKMTNRNKKKKKKKANDAALYQREMWVFFLIQYVKLSNISLFTFKLIRNKKRSYQKITIKSPQTLVESHMTPCTASSIITQECSLTDLNVI